MDWKFPHGKLSEFTQVRASELRSFRRKRMVPRVNAPLREFWHAVICLSETCYSNDYLKIMERKVWLGSYPNRTRAKSIGKKIDLLVCLHTASVSYFSLAFERS